jgi:hypothetical protein
VKLDPDGRTLWSKSFTSVSTLSRTAYQVPVSLGLALGRHRRVEALITFLSHPTVAQIGGGMMLGVSFGLD